MFIILIQNSLASALLETEPPLPLNNDDPEKFHCRRKQPCEGGRGGEKEGGLSKNYSFLPRKCASVPAANTPVEDCS